MYDLPYFKEKDQRVVLDFVRRHPFAMLIGSNGGVPVATQVPILIEEHGERGLLLRGHIMRNTGHHKAFQQNSEALLVFSGPHTYVSASWYTDPKTASTWNYMSVHARGQIQFLGEPELLSILDELTARFENNKNSPALFRHLAKSYVDSLKHAIIGFEMEVRELENVFKLSQNRDEQSFDNIIRQLNAQGGDAQVIAEEMMKRRAELFPDGATTPVNQTRRERP